MRKRKEGRKFHRQKDQRKALLKTLASALILNEKIKTTEVKSKEVSKFVEKNITKAKKGTMAARRLLAKFFAPKIVKKLIDDIGPRYKGRNGGYTRIIKLGIRKSDGTKMAIIELVK
ncbi:50S ribosomal protein L17 [Candidatus Parcubacteria bacterium]|nr:50S ribosomal protein L17 [Candidatus Parcubacteria bacterium]